MEESLNVDLYALKYLMKKHGYKEIVVTDEMIAELEEFRLERRYDFKDITVRTIDYYNTRIRIED